MIRGASNISTAIFILFMSILTLSGCSGKTHPDNPEPILTLSEATDISRTEATVTATIDRRGSSTGITYTVMTYSETGNGNGVEIEGDPESTTQTFHLSGLMPGRTYSCILRGGTATATIFSNTVTFTTHPNELPALSAPTTLSTGPLAVIVRFNIIEDGGEPLVEAGCEVRSKANQDIRRILLPPAETVTGQHTLSINALTPGSTYTITPFASNTIGEAHGETLEVTTGSGFILQQPGSLSQLLPTDADLTYLTISGPMNGDDFLTLRTVLGADPRPVGTSPVDIDLRDVVIVEGGSPYDGSRYTVADEISTGLLGGCTRLRHAVLPNTVIRIARDAFTGSTMLQTIEIGASTESITPSGGCDALESISVSAANNMLRAIDGVLFNSEGSEILWFPRGKTGTYTISAGITVIGKNAFAGTSITALIIPPTVKEIRRGAFYGSSLKELTLPDNLTNVTEGMMQDCVTLTDIHLGKGTEYIGNFAFDGTSVADLWVGAELPPYTTEKAFADGDEDIFTRCTLHVPVGCRKIYSIHNRWGRFSRIEEFQP